MDEEIVYEDEYEYDEVVGAREKRRLLDALNKKRLTRWEMDELFAE